MKVFLSSTFRDLVLHRKAAADAIERLGIGLSRMETFGAIPVEPSEACLNKIAESELFVGIYAHRYGFIPDASQISITEAEFNRATELRRPTFCFLVDPDYPWDETAKETGRSAELLQALKARISSLVIPDFFSTPEVLAARVATAVGRFLIADPRKSGAASVDQFARGALSDGATAVFVDIMRLACVSASPAARRANKSRYGDFIDLADEHLSNYRVQLARLTAGGHDGFVNLCADLDVRLAWAINRLRRSSTLSTPWKDFVPTLAKLADDVSEVAARAAPKYFEDRVSEVSAVTNGIEAAGASLLDPDTFVHRRFKLQSDILRLLKGTAAITIATVADDMDRVLAIPYFAIDRGLLCAARAGSRMRLPS